MTKQQLPSQGVLKLEFCSSHKPDLVAVPLSTSEFEAVWHNLVDARKLAQAAHTLQDSLGWASSSGANALRDRLTHNGMLPLGGNGVFPVGAAGDRGAAGGVSEKQGDSKRGKAAAAGGGGGMGDVRGALRAQPVGAAGQGGKRKLGLGAGGSMPGIFGGWGAALTVGPAIVPDPAAAAVQQQQQKMLQEGYGTLASNRKAEAIVGKAKRASSPLGVRPVSPGLGSWGHVAARCSGGGGGGGQGGGGGSVGCHARWVTDDWKRGLLGVLLEDCYFTSAQAKHVVEAFNYGEYKVDAAVKVRQGDCLGEGMRYGMAREHASLDGFERDLRVKL